MDPTKLLPNEPLNMDSSIQNNPTKTTNEPPKVIFYMKGQRNNGKSQLYPLMCHIFGDYAYQSTMDN